MTALQLKSGGGGHSQLSQHSQFRQHRMKTEGRLGSRMFFFLVICVVIRRKKTVSCFLPMTNITHQLSKVPSGNVSLDRSHSKTEYCCLTYSVGCERLLVKVGGAYFKQWRRWEKNTSPKRFICFASYKQSLPLLDKHPVASAPIANSS